MKRQRVSDDFEDNGGDELTRFRKQIFRGDVADGFRQFADNHSPNKFVEKLADLSTECDAILKSFNLPTTREVVAVDAARKWIPVEDAKDLVTGKRRAGYASYTGAAFVLETALPFSEAWYAAKIGELCWLIDIALSPSDSVSLLHIFELGRWIEDRSWRFRHKKSILTGRRVRQAAREGGDIRSARISPTTAKVLQAMKDCLSAMPKPNVSHAARLVYSRGIGKSTEANRQLWHTHRGKKL